MLLHAIVAEPVATAYSGLGRDIVAADTTAENCLLRLALWTHLVNGLVAVRVRDVPPFPHVRESLAKIAPQADIMVVSATPNEALQREWEEHDIARYAAMICGQEMGKKAEHLQYGAGGKYPPEKILMVGDAPGDLKAARANHACFFPVNPGGEAASWQRFYEEAAERFFAGEYRGQYEDGLVADFAAHLPSVPPWRK
jgi:phosphoglycolate phosphatase-like HAD superfamily hydrolase